MGAHEVRRILIYRIGHIGDTIIALPAIWAIRQQFPRAHVTLLCNRQPKSHYVLASQILPARGLVDETLVYPSHDTGSSLLEMMYLLPKIRRQHFDTLVYLAPRMRSRRDVRRDLLYFHLAGIRNVIGHKGIDQMSSGQAISPLPHSDHEADHLIERLRRSNITVPETGKGEMNLALSDDERGLALQWLKERIAHYPEKAKLVGIAPGSKWPSKIWPEARFQELGSYLIRELNLYPVVFGGIEDVALGNRLIESWGMGANAAGELNIRQAAAALSYCQLYVGNDTGAMHLAAAVGTRCVVTMSAQDWPGRWNPYGIGHTVLRSQVPCEGCLLRVCDTEQLRCLTTISVEDVLLACRQTVSQVGV